MRILSVDPSIENVGIATLTDGVVEASYTFRTKPIRTEQRLHDLAVHFRNMTNEYDVALVELPGTFVRSGRWGIKNLRSIQLLHMAIGAIMGGLAHHPFRTEFVDVQDWKDNTVKKRDTQLQVRLRIGREVNEHEADAIMMGMKWLQRRKITEAAGTEKRRWPPAKS